MRKAAPLLVLAALFLAGPAAAQAQDTPSPNAVDSTPLTCDDNPVSLHVKKAKRVIRHAYAHSRWRKAHPFTKRHQKRVSQHKKCLFERRDRRVIGKYRVKKLRSFRAYRKRQLAQNERGWCAPNPHPAGGGCWVIPEACVLSESGGSWTAQNPTSPARGPYQLLSHGEPWPVDSRADAMAHHRIAASLPYPSSWVAPGCG